jgi:hypothetical protein
MTYAAIAVGTNPSFSLVEGGTLASDATYYYRVFASNGTFNVSNVPLTCDILTIAGGGGPGGAGIGTNDPGGPGGAGGVIQVSNEVVPVGTSWPIVIGGGGAGGGTTTNGTNGTNTTVNGTTIIATGGGGGALASSTTTANAGSNGGSGGGGSASSVFGTNGAGGTASAGTTSGLNGTVTTRAFAGGAGLGRTTASQRSSGGGGGSNFAGGGAAFSITAIPGSGGSGTAVFSSWLSACVSAIPQWKVINNTASGSGGLSSTITTDSTNLFTGMLVTGGSGINPGSTITSIPNDTSITIDRFNSSTVSGPLTFTLTNIAGGGPGITFGGLNGSARGGTKRGGLPGLINTGAGASAMRTNATASGSSGIVIIRYLRSAVGG